MSEQPEKSAGNSACQKTSSGVLPCALVCATIAFIAYLNFMPHAATPTRRLWLPVVVDTNGTQTALGETRQMEFWTPSAKTKDYLEKGGEIAAKEKWQMIASDEAVDKFGAMLHSNLDVFGYRRVEVWGQGRTTFKPGWWWTMNVTTNYTAVDLVRTYQKYWNTPQAVLVEVIDNRGIDEK